MNPFSQFNIKTIIPINIAGIDVSFTNSSMSIVTVVSIIFLLSKYSKGKVQILLEMIYFNVRNIVTDTLGQKGIVYMPFFISIFLIILLGNLLGLIPGFFTFTSHIIATFTLSAMVIFSTIILGLYHQGFKFIYMFFPHEVPKPLLLMISPIEIFTFLCRSVSLSIRLFANMIAGHVLLDILLHFVASADSFLGYVAALFSLFGALAVIAYEIFVSSIQAYIFTVLSCTYIKDSLESH